VHVNHAGVISQIDWAFRSRITGNFTVPTFIRRMHVQIEGTRGRVYERDEIPGTALSHVLEETVPYDCLNRLHLPYTDTAGNHYVFTFERPNPGMDCGGGSEEAPFNLAFNFQHGQLVETDAVTAEGQIAFPSPLAYYFAHFELDGASPPPSVFFTGPAGSQLTDSESSGMFTREGGAGYNSRTVGPSSEIVGSANAPGGLWQVRDGVGGNLLGEFTIEDPQSASRAVLVVPTVTRAGGLITRVDWVYKDTAGNVLAGPPAHARRVLLGIDGQQGESIVRLFDFEADPSVQFADVSTAVTYADVTIIQMNIVDDLGHRYTSYWSRANPPAPVITSLDPSIGPVSSTVVITGQNFGCTGCVGGVNSVRFNGVSASFTIDSPTQVTATVPAGATTGFVTVQTIGGTGTSPEPFTVIPD
jgi:hypothetical protein